MTVVLFLLFGLPCLFCARLCRSCLADIKIFFIAAFQAVDLGSIPGFVVGNFSKISIKA